VLKKNRPVTALSMLEYLEIGGRYRPPSSLSMRQCFEVCDGVFDSGPDF
jgi:hypothetical protein